MGVKAEWKGLNEFLTELRAVPEDCNAEGMTIIHDVTESAANELRSTYPRKTGVLAGRVRTVYPASKLLIGVVSAAAPHAHLFEWDHKKRGPKGGVVEGRKIAPKVARRWRATMSRRIIDMLRRKGFKIGNEP